MSNIIDKKLFEQIFGHTIEKLANKLINTINKEENQIIVNNINENKEKIYEKDETRPFYDYVIQSSDRRNNLTDAIDLILDFNKTMQLDLVWKYKNQRIKNEQVILIGKNSQNYSAFCVTKKIILFFFAYI